MIRYNEDPCLNLNGPERKFKLLLDGSTLFNCLVITDVVGTGVSITPTTTEF